MLKELAVVRLYDGRTGTILEAFENGAAFLVEIRRRRRDAGAGRCGSRADCSGRFLRLKSFLKQPVKTA